LDKKDEKAANGWTSKSKRVGVVAKKLGMTTEWDNNGEMKPITILWVLSIF
jgi:hypothetical protein